MSERPVQDFDFESLSSLVAEAISTSAQQAQINLQEIEELKKQVLSKTEELELVRQERDAAAGHVKALEEEVAKVKGEAQSASKEMELSLLQLHRLQEELEQYIYQLRNFSELLQNKHKDQQQRIRKLISDLASKSNLGV